MRCPFCNAEKESLKVIDSRTCDGGRSIRRRRECLNCSKRFTTYERIEENVRLTVVKKDGRRVPWDREKIVMGLERACFKRPVPESEMVRLADEGVVLHPSPPPVARRIVAVPSLAGRRAG